MALVDGVVRAEAGGQVELVVPGPDVDAPPPRLSVVVPSYKDGPRIVDCIERLTAELDETGLAWEVIVVVDGDPETYRAAQTLRSDKVTVLGYGVNRGKGFALRLGISNARGEVVTFIDSDMEIDPHQIGNMEQLLRMYNADVVVGSKRHPLSEVHYPLLRRFQSLCYQLLIRLLFRLRVRDTQTGLKVMRREVAMRVLDVALVKRFAFDVELLVLCRYFGFRRIIEAPVTIQHKFSSTTNMRAVLQVLWDTAAIFYRLRIRRYYRGRTVRGVAALRANMPVPLSLD